MFMYLLKVNLWTLKRRKILAVNFFQRKKKVLLVKKDFMKHINNFLFKRRRSKYLLRRSIAFLSTFRHLLFKNTIKHLLTIYGLAFKSFPRHYCHKTNSWSKKDLDVTSCQIIFLDYPVNSIK